MLKFFCSLDTILDIWLHFISGYYPEGDRQTKCMNQILKQYLCVYCNYQQDNWSELLPLAEFAYNNAPSATTGVSPFFVSQIRYSLVVILELNSVSEVQYKDMMTDR